MDRERPESGEENASGLASAACRRWVTVMLAAACACASSSATEIHGPGRPSVAGNMVDATDAVWSLNDGEPDRALQPHVEGGSADSSCCDAGATSAAEPVLADEVPYPPFGRPRPGNSIAASSDDELLARWNRGSGTPLPARPPHPAPRVRVDVVETSRRFSHLELQRAARARGYWPIRLCYEEALRQSQRLHATLRFQLTVDMSGVVQAARIVRSDTDDNELAVCIGRSLRKLTLAGPVRGIGTGILEVSLWPGDSPVPRRSDESRALAWTVRDLTDMLRAEKPAILRCYVQGLQRNPGLWGRMALEFEIGADGEVKSVHETESQFAAPEVTECAKRVFSRCTLPRPANAARFIYALRFGSIPEPSRESTPGR
jgi:hypothetical protein